MKKLSSLALFSAFAAPSLSAAVVYADFNDNTAGQLSHATPGTGQAGGAGFDPDANNTWGNTGTLDAVSGDLSAPGSTGYALTQSGTPLSIQGDFASGRQTTRATATTMGTASDIWFSFLLNQPTANSRGGVTFNQNAFAPGNPRIVAVGTDVRIALGATLQDPGGGTSMSLTSDTLFLGQLVIDATGDETLNIWINPDVSGGIAGLGAASTSLTENAGVLDGGLNRVGVQSYSSDGQGGIVDAFIVSDDADPNAAFAAVTGVSVIPEPSTAALALLAVAGFFRRRR